MNIKQLRKLIKTILSDVNMYSESAEELLILTACTESLAGEYVYQVGGPAKGIFQMEPDTEADIWNNYLRYRPQLASLVKEYKLNKDDLVFNLAYQIIMARVHYRRIAEPLPKAPDHRGLAVYWKKYYNTPEGKGKVDEALERYKELAL